MLIVRWLAVWDASENATTEVHVFPAAKHIAAPYPVHCRLAIVGQQDRAAQLVTLDGGKVNQPLRVKLAEVFKEASGLCGVLIELLPTRRSLDLTYSRCQVERRTSDGLVRYVPWALPVISRPERHNPGTMRDAWRRNALPLVVDSQNRYSLLSINSSSESQVLRMGLNGAKTDSSLEVLERDGQHIKSSLSVGANACVELPLIPQNEKLLLSFAEPRNEDVAIYVVGRNVSNGSITLISSI